MYLASRAGSLWSIQEGTGLLVGPRILWQLAGHALSLGLNPALPYPIGRVFSRKNGNWEEQEGSVESCK